jgi:hypothetical protein
VGLVGLAAAALAAAEPGEAGKCILPKKCNKQPNTIKR